MKSQVIKRSIVLDGHKTSVSLEDPFWASLKEIARGRHATLTNVIADLDTRRGEGNLSSAIRLFVLDHYRKPTLPVPVSRLDASMAIISGTRARLHPF
jgi:predicted DNA-binding ribbon-helix-helix protein